MKVLEKLERYWHGRLNRPYQLKCPVDKGRGEVVVLLHGIASSGQSWQPVIDELDQRKYRIIALDLLGFGTSPQPNWLEYSIDDHVKSIMITLKRKRVRKPFVLVGHSMGSLVAAEIAHQYPHKVKHLILHQMPAYNPEFALDERSIKHRAYRKVFAFIAEHPRITLLGAQSLSGVAAKLGGFSLNKQNWYAFEMSLKNTILEKAKRNKHTLTMPTDVIYGRYDLLILRKNAEQFFSPSPKLRFYQVSEIHRMAKRSGKLIAELIEQNTAKDRTLSKRNATLLRRFAMKKAKAVDISSTIRRRTALLWSGFFAVAFAVTAVAAAKHTVTGWEYDMFKAVNMWQAPDIQVFLARVLSDAVWVMVGVIACLVLYSKTRATGLKIAVPAVIVYVIGYVLEHIINRGRPDVLLQNEAIIRGFQDGPGFTSGHMLAATAVVCVLWPRASWLVRILFVLLLVLEGWARIFLGMHFPLDVIGGVLLAIAVCCGLYALPAKARTVLRIG